MGEIQMLRPIDGGQNLAQSNSDRTLRGLRSGVGSDPTSQAKARKAAQDFEGVLVGQWLEQAEKSFATVPGGDPDQQADPGHDQLRSIALQSLASNLTKSGGLGIATMIVKHLTNNDQAPNSARETREAGRGPAIQIAPKSW
jgi:Rod binding domain-containing protein